MSLCDTLKTNVFERYNNLIAHAPVGILLVALDGEIVEVNPKALEILGSPGEEATKHINMLTFPPLTKVGISELTIRALSGEEVRNDILYTSTWNKTSNIRFTAVPIYDENESVCFSLIIMEDITDYSQLKSELKKTNSLLKTVIDAIPSLIWMKDREGRYIQSNKAFNEFNSFLGTSIIGMTDHEIWPEDQAKMLRADDIVSMECNYPLEIHETLLHPTLGARHFKTIKVGACSEDGNIIGSVGVSCDITKHYEQSLVVEEHLKAITETLQNNTLVR